MFRRSRARATLLAVIATFALIAPVAAGDFRSDTTVTVGDGESIDDDLYVGAGQVVIDGTVNGDATIAGGTVRVNGTVNGSLNVGAGTVEVSGDVTGAVRVSGGTVRIAGSVGRDLVVFAGTTTIDSSAEIAGDVAGAGGTMTIDGTVGGDLLAGGGTIELSGSVDGAIEVTVGELTIESGAVVGGDVTYTSANEATIDGEVGGEVTRHEPQAAPVTSIVQNNPIVSYLGLLLGMLALGWALLAVRPRLTIGSADVLRTSPLLSFGIGIAALIGQFILITILVICAGLLAVLAGALGGGFVAVAFVVLLLIILALDPLQRPGRDDDRPRRAAGRSLAIPRIPGGSRDPRARGRRRRLRSGPRRAGLPRRLDPRPRRVRRLRVADPRAPVRPCRAARDRHRGGPTGLNVSGSRRPPVTRQ